MKGAIVFGTILLPLLLIACDSEKVAETLPATAVPQESASEIQIVDSPLLSEEEVCVKVWEKLPGILPDEYKIGQFNRDTRRAEYLGDGKWLLIVAGSGESRINRPQETIKESAVVWVYRWADNVTSYNLTLTADYYENLRMLELVNIERTEGETRIEVKNENRQKAYLEVNHYTVDRIGDVNFRFYGSITNMGSFPLENVTIKATCGSQELGTIQPKATTNFNIEYTGANPDLWDTEESPYDVSYFFIAGDGTVIPNFLSLKFIQSLL